MPFLARFRKDKESVRTSPSFSRTRSSIGSSPPQLGDISPQSDLSYVLPELDELRKEDNKRRVLHRRRESAQTIPSPRTSTTSPRASVTSPRPLSEGLTDRVSTNANRNLTFDSDDDPLVPPPPRASVFAGFSYSEGPRAQSAAAELPQDMKKRNNGSGRGLFGWRKKDVTVTTPEPTESSFSLKSFRHVGPPSPVVKPEESTASLPVVELDSPTASSSTARPVPGRSETGRERVNSTSSEGMMAAGLFRQAARRSSTNLVEDAAEPIRSRMRDLEKRGPPTRSWADESISSTSTGPRKSAPDTSSRKNLDDEPESPSPFAGRLGTSPFTTRSESGHARIDYSMYGARSDGGRSTSKLASRAQSPMSRAQSPKPVVSRVFSDSPAQIPSTLPNTRPGPQGYTGPRSPTKPRPSSPEKPRVPASPTKPRLSAPAATRPPIRTTIPTKTNDGPSIKPQRRGSGSSQNSRAQMSALGHGRRPSASESMRSVTVDVRPSRQGVESRRPSVGALSQSHTMATNSTQSQSTTQDPFSNNNPSRRPSVDVLSHARRPSGFEVISRPKSPGPSVAVDSRPAQVKTTDQLRQEAIEAMRGDVSRSGSSSTESSRKAPSLERSGPNAIATPPTYTRTGPTPIDRTGPTPMERAKSPAPQTNTATESTPRKNYVPPPRASSLAAGLVDSDTDESPEEVESESEGLGFGVGAMRGRHVKDATIGHTRDATLAGKSKTSLAQGKTSPATQGTSPTPSAAGTPSKETSPRMGNRDDGLTRERTITQRDRPIGVSLFDGPVPRTRASHSTSAISAAATARNAATLAEANRATFAEGNRTPFAEGNRNTPAGANRTIGKHSRAGSFSAVSKPAGTDTDEDEDESEESSEDDAPLSTLAPARRPGSAASTAASVRPGPRPSLPTPQSRATAPLINIPGVTSPPPRPPRINRVPGVGVTRNSSLRGSRSVEDLGRMPVRPGPRPFVTSPPSSTGDSSSGKAPLTPRDGSEAGRGRSDEARRKERRRSEAKKSVELGNVINGPGPIPDDDEDNMSMGHSQMGHAMGMMGMGWNQSGFFPPGGFGGFPTSQSMPFLHPQMTGQPMPPMGFMPPPPPPGASEVYLQAHQQAMMIAKQTYLSAVAQQAMAAATEQWERSSNMGGSVYGGSQASVNMGMMGVPMMGIYPGSSYAASAYEGSVAGWGSASAYGGPSGPRSVYGGARSEYGGGLKSKPGPGPNRPRGKPQSGDSQPRRDPVPPSTWATRRSKGL